MKNTLSTSSLRISMIFSLLFTLLGSAGFPASARASEPNYQAIATGDWHTCVLTSNGGVQCWGRNETGQLGNNTRKNSSMPVAVNGLTSGVQAIAAGAEHTCALTRGGGVKCWGWNYNGQLGNGTNTNSSTPVNVSGLASGVQAIAAGAGHTCALTSGGGVKCWGWNSYGQLGNGTNTNSSTPVDAIGLADVKAIAVGGDHTCALATSGDVKCWGWNKYGQLGNGTDKDSNTPVDVSGLTRSVTAVTAGEGHTCALTSSKDIKCWGWNYYGQLGDETNTDSDIPVDVDGLSDVGKIAAGGGVTCALVSGIVKCWGANYEGQLGNGTWTDSSTPVDVINLPNEIKAIDPGAEHTCALTKDGFVMCWGWNYYGQLGNGTNRDSNTPVEAARLATQIIYSVANRDGWVLESTETSNQGGTLSTKATLIVGDDTANKQYISILYFDTKSLPLDAIIANVTLKIKRAAATRISPFKTHGDLLADIKKGYFGTKNLEVSDFQSPASKPGIGRFVKIDGQPGWYQIALVVADYPFINRVGVTQFRLRFAKGDNHDSDADFVRFYAGDAAAASKPLLIIEYYAP